MIRLPATTTLPLLLSALLLAACDPPEAPSPPKPVARPLSAQATAALEQATELQNRGQTDQAIEILEASLRDHGTFFETLDAVSVCYIKTDYQLKAQEAALKAHELKPKALRPLTTLGISCFDTGDLDKAEDYLQRAIAIDPKPGVLAVLGQVYLRLGRPSEATAALQRSLGLKPDQAACHYDLGVVAMREGDHEEAEKRFRKALELNPDDTRAIFNLGNVLRRSGKTELAERVLKAFNERQELLARVKALESAVEAHPKNLAGLGLLGDTLIKLNKIDRGVGCYMRILAIDPAHKRTLRTLVDMSLQLGYVDSAIDTLKQAESVAPDDAEIKAMRRQLEAARK
jgi:tetratricopeptide (TPR) repeat protein